MNDIQVLEQVLKFLNEVPNNKYGDNYSLTSKLPSIIKRYSLSLSTLHILRVDAETGLNGEWDCTTDEGKEGFQCQIDLINKVLISEI